ncbi:MAG: holo-ACP synthase [Spirochaetaceae bacterium]|jgi:holo-[acyl-carrier protein] synthase|nr:holo-ACP synthase [Spirochaetaceae bacterium]
MIVGIGVDAVTVSRLEKWAADPHILERFFDGREIETARERGRGMVRSLAVRFAAKEAFGKALGTGLAGISLKDIMVLNGLDTRPELQTEGTALAAMKAAGARKAHVSLTHEKDLAVAVVVLEA